MLSPRAWTTQAVEEYVHFGTVKEVDRCDCKLICALSMALKGSGGTASAWICAPSISTCASSSHDGDADAGAPLITRDDWLMTIDLESAYNNFHVREDSSATPASVVGRALLHVCRALLRQQRGPLLLPADHRRHLEAPARHGAAHGLLPG